MAINEKYPEQVNLENCAREPIHIIGKIQEHGVLLACNINSLEITQASRNTYDLFGIGVNDLLGKPLTFLLDGQQVDLITRSLETE